MKRQEANQRTEKEAASRSIRTLRIAAIILNSVMLTTVVVLWFIDADGDYQPEFWEKYLWYLFAATPIANLVFLFRTYKNTVTTDELKKGYSAQQNL